MSAGATIAQRGRALLIQAMERRWPGCGAHTKRNQINGRDELVWSSLLTPDVQRDIRVFVEGWEEGIAGAVRIMQDTAPFEDAVLLAPARRPGRHQATKGTPTYARQGDVAAAALAGLEALFAPGPAEKADGG